MTAELRSTAEVASWLSAGLLLRRVAVDDEHVQAIIACANELPTLPPPGVIADVAALLGGARLPRSAPVAAGEALRTAILAYDDDVLSRLVTTSRFDDVVAAFAHIPDDDKLAAVALVVGAICERSGFTGVSVSPATLRRALARPREERETAGRAELHGPTAQRLADAYLRIARGARQNRALVDDREVFAIDHLDVLRDLGGRMTADHVASAAAALARTFPRRLPANRQHRGARDTNLSDDSLYPAGGFSAITPGGANASIENLVTSELVYMEDGAGPDVFTVRYVEGELLYYTRDDSVFRRQRHSITILLGADLEDARVKDRDLPWQRLVLALGLVVAAIRWITEQLGDEALAVQLAFPPNALAEERAIVALMLEGEIARGTVAIVEQAPGDAIATADAARPTAITDVVVVSLGAPPAIPKGLRALHVDLAGATPRLAELSPRLPPPHEPGADVWSQWCDSAEDVLRWLV